MRAHVDQLPELDLDDDSLSHPDGDSDSNQQNWDMGAVESINTVGQIDRKEPSTAQVNSISSQRKNHFDIRKISIDNNGIDDDDF